MRLTFSIATSIPADILLLDEWLSVGDKSFQAKAEGRMKAITTEAAVYVIASHNYDMLSNLCNRIFLLDNGKLVSDKDI